MLSGKDRSVVLSLGMALISASSPTRTALGSTITSSWSGASASVYFDTQNQSQQGSTANASAGGSFTLNYEGSPAFNTPQYFQSTVTGNVAAGAGGDASTLLQVSGASNAPNPGTLGYSNGTHGLGGATASWTNDAAIVTAAAGSTLPDTVRLNFTLTFTDQHGAGPEATLQATFNGTQLNYYGTDMGFYPHPSEYGGIAPEPGNASAVDSSTAVVKDGWETQVIETFHLNLPLNSLGVSNPFSLSLQLTPYVGLFSNSPVTDGLSASIGLTSVTLPDGTPLSALGDSVSFESGLIAPTAAPEPASVLAWGIVTAAAGVAAIRRSRSSR
jgi:hypothetical protein